MNARWTTILSALVALAGCGKIVGIRDFSPADAGFTVDGPGSDLIRDVRVMDVQSADTVAWLDAAVDRGFDLPSADSAGHDLGEDSSIAIAHDAGPDGKTCPPLKWQAATTSILANSGGNACNFASATLPAFAAAIDDLVFDQTRGCGICLRLVPGRTDVVTKYVDVLVVDSTGSGDSGRQMNISRQAMDAIATPGTQILMLNFTVVPCPTSLIAPTIHMTEQHSSNPQHRAVQVRHQAFPVTALDIWFADGWKPMTFEPYNFWTLDSPGIVPPYSFRLTSNLGDTLVIDDVTLFSTATEDGDLVDTKAQFPSCIP